MLLARALYDMMIRFSNDEVSILPPEGSGPDDPVEGW